MRTATRWINLDGAVNARDLGGLPTTDGSAVLPNRLIRSDNLQDLTSRDVEVLVGEHQLRAVADLRTGVEVESEGPGPLVADPRVRVEHFSFFPEPTRAVDVTPDGIVTGDGTAAEDSANGAGEGGGRGAGRDGARTDVARLPVLPWQQRREQAERGGDRPRAASIYLGYLTQRADSVLDALRLIANTDGATIVHCAAGKDRTGVLTALALGEVGVTREAIVADYAASAERIEAIFDRLLSSPLYADDLGGDSIAAHRPRPETMQRLLDAIDAEHGGVATWLRANGWTSADAAALRVHLLG